MNLENLNLIELNAQEVESIEGGGGDVILVYVAIKLGQAADFGLRLAQCLFY